MSDPALTPKAIRAVVDAARDLVHSGYDGPCMGAPVEALYRAVAALDAIEMIDTPPPIAVYTRSQRRTVPPHERAALEADGWRLVRYETRHYGEQPWCLMERVGEPGADAE